MEGKKFKIQGTQTKTEEAGKEKQLNEMHFLKMRTWQSREASTEGEMFEYLELG